mmetsp:Transcript_54999/g.163756  ORF Transcript_54999/g.163756 Transcript_54999/m.163756 type:complete len:235 (-) Transcript_54999:35-739(-)
MDQRTPRPPGLCGSRRTLRRRALRERVVMKLRLTAGQGGYADGPRGVLDEVCRNLETSCELVKQRARGMGLVNADAVRASEEMRVVIDMVERMMDEFESMHGGVPVRSSPSAGASPSSSRASRARTDARPLATGRSPRPASSSSRSYQASGAQARASSTSSKPNSPTVASRRLPSWTRPSGTAPSAPPAPLPTSDAAPERASAAASPGLRHLKRSDAGRRKCASRMCYGVATNA